MWTDEFRRFSVELKSGKSKEDDLTIFYTSLYHSLLSPTKWSEANGLYLGFDMQIHTKPDDMDSVYTDLSIWDVFRT